MGDAEGSLPASQPQSDDAVLSAGMAIAARWGSVLDAEQLRIALVALEPQLKREHQALLKRLDMQNAQADREAQVSRELAEREAQEKREQRRHNRYMTGIWAGAVLAVAMLGAGVYVAEDAWWLAALLCGPSLLAIAKVFVLRRTDPGDMRIVARAATSAANAVPQEQSLPPA